VEKAAEVRSEVEVLRNALKEVKELAEGVQKKATSTEAQLEAEVSTLRTAPVLPAPAPSAEPPAVLPSGWNFATVPDFPKVFEDFKKNNLLFCGAEAATGSVVGTFTALRRGPEHSYCDFGQKLEHLRGFTHVEWDSTSYGKVDPSLKSFLFTLKNTHNVPARRFALKAEEKDQPNFSCNF
jgi:hypothetical protein